MFLKNIKTLPTKKYLDKDWCDFELHKHISELRKLQKKLYSSQKHSLLLVFQALDAAGKDSTIKAVMTGINPAGCEVYSFKQPTEEELRHDFLWRAACKLPKKGRIGVFNRSYYEEVLVVKVHPEILKNQKINYHKNLWQERYESINNFEQHLARNNTHVLKFYLHVSEQEQKARILKRLNQPEDNWKFTPSDLKERAYRKKYAAAYEALFKATSTKTSPWHIIPADFKPYTHLKVSEIILNKLKELKLTYPKLSPHERKGLAEYKKQLL